MIFRKLLAGLATLVLALSGASASTGPLLLNGKAFIAIPGTGVLNTSPPVTNPMGLAYQSTTGTAAYGHPTGMLITGRSNRDDPAFQTVRTAGGKILAYFDLVEATDCAFTTTCSDPYDAAFWLGVTYWPYLTQGNGGPPAGQHRRNTAATYLADITVGSSWVTTAVGRIATYYASGNYDGVFIDVTGARLFSTGTTGANWSTDWGSSTACPGTECEHSAWTLGNIDLVRQLAAALPAGAIIVNNNVWNDAGITGLGTPGQQYVNGVCLEHHAAFASGAPSANAAYARDATFGRLPRHILSIGVSTADAIQWQLIPNVTEISDQASYVSVSTPPIPFHSNP